MLLIVPPSVISSLQERIEVGMKEGSFIEKKQEGQ